MRVFSGIQPTGVLHLGNYFGMLRNSVKLQDEGNECFYSIVNLHAITLPQDPEALKKHTLEVAATMLAVGINPEKSVLFVQSDVPESTQLAWILSCLAPFGQMGRMVQFKEKSATDAAASNLGFFSYPVLQAADILLYKADLVPVGRDQAQHLELCRELATKFNTRYGDFFPIPKTIHPKITKVVGLDGSAKMSKSANNYIGITEDRESIWKKLKPAATDPARVTRFDPGNPFICNIYKLHELFSPKNDIEIVIDGCQTAKIGCIDCKQILFEHMDSHLKPIRDRYNEWMSDTKKVEDVLKAGAEKARGIARETLAEVYDLVGFSYTKK